jgi:uncharacterized integral membrane protein (TIGR00698 family)
MSRENISKIIFILCALACLTPFVSPPIALLLGFVFSQTVKNPFIKYNNKITKYLLQFSVVGLGFGMNLFEAAEAGKQGLVFTVSSILVTLALGLVLGKIFSVKRNTTVLISSGTAICGGSAIAAISPVIEAQEDEMSISLGTVFILNAIALFIFPAVGHYFNLSQNQFGLWAAVAIHDTSSVVGAAHKYGEEALQIATTVKMERALWIIPLSLILAVIFKKKTSKIKIPYFIFFFVVAMAINTFVPATQEISPYLVMIAKKGLTLTLFFIGAGLTRSALKNVGIKPLLLGAILWIFISVTSLWVIMQTVS